MTLANSPAANGGFLFSLPDYRPLGRKLLDPGPTQNGRLTLPKDQGVQPRQIFGQHALNSGPQRHRTVPVQRDNLFWIES